MNWSQIKKEKTSNSNNSIVMNHTMNESELIKTLSVETSFVKCDREHFDAVKNRGSDNGEIGEHIYENVEHFAKNKHRSLSEFVSSLKSKTKDLKIKKIAKKLKPEMIENPGTSEIRLMSNNKSYRDKEDSYTSCQEENIYENLNLNFHRSWSDDKTVLENDALRSWILQLSMSVEDYDYDEIMITKCIPSKHKNILCNFEAISTGSTTSLTAADMVLDQYKLDILNKCFTAIWRQESEDEILSNLYIFLNDVFSSYFIKNATLHHQKAESNKTNNLRSTERKRRKRPGKMYGTMCKKIDKETIEKLETFILSVSLNRLTITYDNCMKFYFALETSQTRLFSPSGGTSNTINYYLPLIINNCRRLELKNRKELRDFSKILKLILSKSVLAKTSKKSEEIVEIYNDVVNREQVIAKEENIYQPIWKWHTDCKSVITRDTIYTPLDFIIELDEQDWEIDSEFSFVDSRNALLASKENMFDSICILYSNENPELNKIIYSHKSSNIINDRSEKTLLQTLPDNYVVASQSKGVIQRSDSSSKNLESGSVTAWKQLLRHPYYLEDEEDLVSLVEPKMFMNIEANNPFL